MERSWAVLYLLVAINIFGIAYGYYFYYDQLASSPLYLWPFIPDCPLYVMVFTFALLLTLYGYEFKLLNYIAAVGMMEYGAWTLMALLLFSDQFFSGPLWVISSVLFVLHIGMFSEGLLLIPKKLNIFHFSAGLLWFIINDYFDYFYGYLNAAGRYVLGTHPILPSNDRIQVVMVLTFMLSIAMCVIAYRLSSANMPWPLKKEIAEAQKTTKTMRGSRNSSA